ncbi:hypothetical protein GF407_13660 [candidate division KSB1 bacterium]|nr:hypothetical protein [candidate division KSB1 bacterium]
MNTKYLLCLLFLFQLFYFHCASIFRGAPLPETGSVALRPDFKPENVHYRPALSNPRIVELGFKAELEILKVEEPSTPYLLIWSFLPTESRAQRGFKIKQIKPSDYLTYIDSRHGNRYAYWNLDSVDKIPDIQLRFSCTCYEQDYDIDPERVGDYDRTSAFYRFYTREDPALIPFDQLETSTVRVEEKQNGFYAFQALGRGYSENDSTLLQQHRNRLPDTTSVGNSINASVLFLSYCRASGIPARLVTGYRITESEAAPWHWIEFFLPEYGWIPFDPCEPAARIGYWPNRYFISTTGMNLELPNLSQWVSSNKSQTQRYGLRFIKIVSNNIQLDKTVDVKVK